MERAATFFAVFVFAWQLWAAGRTFSLPAGEAPRVRHHLLPIAFVLVLAVSFPATLRRELVPVGLVGLGGSLLLFEWARRSIRGQYFSFVFSRDVPAFLWRNGPFRYIRNPFYASYMLSAASVVVMFPSLPVLLAFAILVLSVARAARHEERKFLTSSLRSEYQAYARRAGRFIPGVGRLR